MTGLAPGRARRLAAEQAACEHCTTGSCEGPAPYVRRTPAGDIWVTLPGDNCSRQLLTAEARKLLRDLEAVV
jgi:hypothetical protein